MCIRDRSAAFPEEWPTFGKVSKAQYGYEKRFKALRALYSGST